MNDSFSSSLSRHATEFICATEAKGTAVRVIASGMVRFGETKKERFTGRVKGKRFSLASNPNQKVNITCHTELE
jgi:hypothetical protein